MGKKVLALLAIFILACEAVSIAAEVMPEAEPEIKIESTPLRAYNDLQFTPQSIRVEQPNYSLNVSENLSAVPGVTARSYSGAGSLQTASTPYAFGAGQSDVYVDEIPVADPLKLGVNLSLFPSALLESAELQTPNRAQNAGGAIKLAPLAFGLQVGEKKWDGAIQAGSGHTLQGSVDVQTRGDRSEWIVGVSPMTTKGDYRFAPFDKHLEDNAAYGCGALVKYRYHLGKTAQLDVLDLFSDQKRVNGGSLDFRFRQREQDFFNLTGARFEDQTLFSEHTGFSATLAGTYSKVETTDYTPSQTSTKAGFAQTGANYKNANSESGFLEASMLVENRLEAYSPEHNRSFQQNTTAVVGKTVIGQDGFKLAPSAKLENSDAFGLAADGGLSLDYSLQNLGAASFSYSYLHSTPSLAALVGNPSWFLLPNSTIRNQRDEIFSFATVVGDGQKPISLSNTVFYQLSHDRVEFFMVDFVQSQYRNLPLSSVLGDLLATQIALNDAFTLQTNASLTHAWDRQTGLDIAYKPRLQVGGSLTYSVNKLGSVHVEEKYHGSQATATVAADGQPQPRILAFAETNLRLDIQVGKAFVFFKANNIFERQGFVTAGYPELGRNFYVGYRFGGRQ